MTPPILMIEDTLSLQMFYQNILQHHGYEVVATSTAKDGQALFEEHAPQIVLLDLMLPDGDGLDLLRHFLTAQPETFVIVVTAHTSDKLVAEAMSLGAFDFLMKPFSDDKLVNAVANAKAAREAAASAGPNAPMRSMQGSSQLMQEVARHIRSVAPSSATVFITGESGTGKELCARAIHETSPRAKEPFVPLNCGAIPHDLLESEVFGHTRGAFNGAISDKRGAVRSAQGGTLFLDEICEMDLDLQTKLLRFLESSTIRPLGAAHPIAVDVRIICATNRDPKAEVKAGRFREDLFYRLHVVPLHMPALRDRGSDVIELAQNAVLEFAKQEHRDFRSLSDEATTLIRNYPWPGNVRQLRNVLRQCVVMNEGSLIQADMLPEEVRSGDTGAIPVPLHPADAGISLDSLMGKTLDEIEQIVIEATIEHCGGSVPKASRMLDVAPSTLYRKREGWTKKRA
ncbi:sigma-54-dependent transcriptional regulator [Actibacterium pelagium]|uniref:Nif-specific regulatory protein n=1 Tax=Actibacterium pelagium TaxID=2029103 RepID=A0A917AAM2_9RHOB|nr:sigma-54 dependent transcriptional regulator [Actibacterium pelagium]GGE39308.1 sigma-54-dependent Fis family transcriptional regulator [Actibacterium pelagium]